MDKKDKELDILNTVINIGLKKRGETKRIIKKISGEEFEREGLESPDFVRFYQADKGNKATMIGIEHMRIDQLSLQKRDGKVASKAALNDKNISKIYGKWKDKDLKDQKNFIGSVSDISSCVAERMEIMEHSSYHTFIESFKYTLEKHIEKTDEYLKELRKLSKNRYDTETAFLLEIHSEFKNLFLNDDRGVKKVNKYFSPFFEDVVELLESIDSKKVNYIFLYLKNGLGSDGVDVVALRTGNIKKRLKEQGIRIYEYAGNDIAEEGFSSLNRKITVQSKLGELDKEKPNELSSIYKVDFDGLNYEERTNFLLHAFKKAHEFKSKGKNFVASYVIQEMLYVFGEYIIRWKRTNDCKREIYSPVLLPPPYDVKEKMDEFENKWDLKKRGIYKCQANLKN